MKKDKRKKTTAGERVTLRLGDDRELVEEAAAAAALPVSEWCRQQAVLAARRAAED